MGATKLIIMVSISIVLLAVIYQQFFTEIHAVLLKFPFMVKYGASIHKLFTVQSSSNESKKKTSKKDKTRIFSSEQLKLYDGSDGNKGPYIAILGQVFNVKKGKTHYGPDGGYSFFSGKDGSRAFVSGDFTEEGLTDDVSGLTSQDYIGLDEWLKFYHKDYKYVGKLIGRFYDDQGKPTPYNLQVQEWTQEAYQQKESDNKEKQFYPPCNSEWYPETGSRVWCTKKSGGVERDWIGVPRQLFNPGRQGARCACIKDFGPPSHDPTRSNHQNRGDLDDPKIEEYKDCDPKSNSCSIPKDKK